MKTKQSIAENLISCRNILVGGRTNQHVLPCLQEVIVNLNLIEIPSTRKIVERCTTEAFGQVKCGDFVSAGRILSLVHNLPLDEANKQRWDIDYFFSMELPTFLEHFEEIKSARQIALYVCGQLAYDYLPKD